MKKDQREQEVLAELERISKIEAEVSSRVGILHRNLWRLLATICAIIIIDAISFLMNREFVLINLNLFRSWEGMTTIMIIVFFFIVWFLALRVIAMVSFSKIRESVKKEMSE